MAAKQLTPSECDALSDYSPEWEDDGGALRTRSGPCSRTQVDSGLDAELLRIGSCRHCGWPMSKHRKEG